VASTFPGFFVVSLVFQDPHRAVRDNEWPGRPANPAKDEGRPNGINLFGTDQAGVDVFAKMVHGTTIALLVGFVSMGIAGSIGIVVGALGGYLGGWVDMLTSRVTEIVMCIPTLVLILSSMALLEKPTIWHTMAIIGATGWTGIARLTRGEFLRLRQSEFVTAARATGAGPVPLQAMTSGRQIRRAEKDPHQPSRPRQPLVRHSQARR
jgi:peptide/nickel transport system permease protein